jgi:DNA replication factor GINS
MRIRSKQVLVRFLKPLESFVGVDMNKYGPFQQEDVASLPLENARSIVESGLAVQIHIQP